MKTIVRILIILEFAAIVFIPGIYLSKPLLALMFSSMALLVVLYWIAMFWVSKKDAEKVLGHDAETSLFVGKLPADPTADLGRGRLCRDGDRLVLLKRTDGQERKQAPCTELWSADINDITSVGFGKVLPARKGFILYFGDEDIRFTCGKAAKEKTPLYNLLGWDVPASKNSES